MVKKWYPSMAKGSLKSFKYEGGENPGARRIVYVLSDTNTRNGTFSAYCFTRKQVRTFSSDKCEDVQDVVNDCKFVQLSHLPQTLQSGEILQKEYVKDGYECFINDSLLVAVKIPKIYKSEVYMDWNIRTNTYQLHVVGKYGFGAKIDINGQTNAELIKALTELEQK